MLVKIDNTLYRVYNGRYIDHQVFVTTVMKEITVAIHAAPVLLLQNRRKKKVTTDIMGHYAPFPQMRFL